VLAIGRDKVTQEEARRFDAEIGVCHLDRCENWREAAVKKIVSGRTVIID